MALSEKARERLQDVRELEPTSNGELRDRWGMDSGKEVAAYLCDELGEYTYRDEDSRIRAVDDAPDADETDSDGATSETGDVTHEPSGESPSDPSPSESDEGSEEQAETADDTASGQTLDLQGPESTDASGGTGNAAADTATPGEQRMELPDDAGPAVDSTADHGCPECGSDRFGYVRDERETLQARGIDVDGLPSNGRICLDCWLAADSPTGATIYTVDDNPTATADAPRQGNLKPAGSVAGGGGEKPACPSCGDVLLQGHSITAMLNDAARRDKTARRFLKANEGVAPDQACRDVYGCGYYVEDGEARTFSSPKGGWGRRLALGAAGAAVVGVAGLAATQNAGQNSGDDILGGGGGSGGDRIL